MGKLLLLFLLGAVGANAQTPSLVTPGKAISQPDLVQPLGKEWIVAKGTWTPANGVLTVHAIPEQKHVPVLSVATGPADLVAECEFLFPAKNSSIIIGCNGKGHVGRAVVSSKMLVIAENSPDPVTKKATNDALIKQPIDVAPGVWTHFRVEYAGDKIAAWVNDVGAVGQHPFLASPKARWWFAATEGVQIRKISFSEGVPVAAK